MLLLNYTILVPRGGLSVLELGAEHREDVVDGLDLEICLVKSLAGSVEHGFGGSEPEILEGLDHPAVDLVAEFIEVYVLSLIYF